MYDRSKTNKQTKLVAQLCHFFFFFFLPRANHSISMSSYVSIVSNNYIIVKAAYNFMIIFKRSERGNLEYALDMSSSEYKFCFCPRR